MVSAFAKIIPASRHSLVHFLCQGTVPWHKAEPQKGLDNKKNAKSLEFADFFVSLQRHLIDDRGRASAVYRHKVVFQRPYFFTSSDMSGDIPWHIIDTAKYFA